MKIGEEIWIDAPISIIIIGVDDEIIAANVAAEHLLNSSERTLSRGSIHDFLTTCARGRINFHAIRTARNTVFFKELVILPKNSPTLTSSARIAPLSPTSAYLAVFLEYWEAATFLDRSAKQKSALRTAIGLSQTLAHEIKNPLTGIAGAAQLLEMSVEPKDKKLTQLIIEETQRIVKLLDQVENFGNLQPTERAPTNVHTALDKARRSAEVGFARHMTFELDYDPSLPCTLADSDQLMQVFLNLIKNAAEASPGGAKIRFKTLYDPRVRVRQPSDAQPRAYLQVEIADNGPGIPADLTDHLFEPFVSGPKNGTGLGLAVVSKIITEHHGWITNDTTDGWTTFRVSLPMTPQ